ncbi:hypothetical protein MOC74_06100 [Bacillus haynesii]|uniref:hypothetical protein n=1 Tax=Bacillus haynesii TaxID=1925021 RepID=UPI00227DA6F5|nr:hypothetical protein [Bacillus haynesii]MCY8345042.1 hypothetical protein [Bacillus haynesii]
MAKVKKHNRVLKVADAAVPGYLKRGYDQVDESGKVVQRATGGRTVALSEHNKALDEIENLKAQLAEAKQAAEKPAAKKSTKKE